MKHLNPATPSRKPYPTYRRSRYSSSAAVKTDSAKRHATLRKLYLLSSGHYSDAVFEPPSFPELQTYTPASASSSCSPSSELVMTPIVPPASESELPEEGFSLKEVSDFCVADLCNTEDDARHSSEFWPDGTLIQSSHMTLPTSSSSMRVSSGGLLADNLGHHPWLYESNPHIEKLMNHQPWNNLELLSDYDPLEHGYSQVMDCSPDFFASRYSSPAAEEIFSESTHSSPSALLYPSRQSSCSPTVKPDPPAIPLHQPRPRRHIPIISLAELASASPNDFLPSPTEKSVLNRETDQWQFDFSPLPSQCQQQNVQAVSPYVDSISDAFTSHPALPAALRNPPTEQIISEGLMVCSCGCMDAC